MKVLKLTRSILEILCVIFIFFNWKISIALFLIAQIFRAIPRGPNFLLSVLTGYLMLGSVIYIFINWRIGIALIVCSLLVAKFRVWGNKVNYEYYNEKNKNLDEAKDK